MWRRDRATNAVLGFTVPPTQSQIILRSLGQHSEKVKELKSQACSIAKKKKVGMLFQPWPNLGQGWDMRF